LDLYLFVPCAALFEYYNADPAGVSSSDHKGIQEKQNREVMRILIVEDDEKIASFVVRGLKEAGFAVDSVTNAEEGLALSSTVPYDAAIVDIMLPGMDGLSMIRKMRTEGVNAPVIILSAKHAVSSTFTIYLPESSSLKHLKRKKHRISKRFCHDASILRI